MEENKEPVEEVNTEVSEENKDVFDEAQPVQELAIEAAVENKVALKPKMEATETEYELEELSDAEKFDVKLAEEDEGKTFEIEAIELGRPNTSQAVIVSETGKELFKTKLKVKYKDTNYMSLLPNIKWYVNDKNGKKILNPWFATNITEEQLQDNFTAETSKLYYRYCIKVDAVVGKVTAKEFVEGLVGMKVKLETTTGKYKGKDWGRIDIKEFI